MKFGFICLTICLIVTGALESTRYSTLGQRNSKSSYRYGFPYWDFNEDYLISNWRRKCSKYNVGNSVKSFISGGILADMDKFPYLVGLVMLAPPRIIQCGGSLITENYVLTAAHCLSRSTAGQVYVGSYVYADAASSAFVYNVSRDDFIINEKYNDRYGFQDDIALIKLRNAVSLSEKVKPIMLPLNFMTQPFLQDEFVIVAGWGRIADNATGFNRRLYYVATPVIAYDKCKCFFLPGLVSSVAHICTGGSGGRGGCDGDSGGPLIFSYNNQDYLVGITSFGSAGGCEIGHPTVYTKVTNYLSWISKNTAVKV